MKNAHAPRRRQKQPVAVKENSASRNGANQRTAGYIAQKFFAKDFFT
jgi:hypothetical protein